MWCLRYIFTTVVKCPDKSNCDKIGIQSILMGEPWKLAGMAWHQEQEAGLNIYYIHSQEAKSEQEVGLSYTGSLKPVPVVAVSLPQLYWRFHNRTQTASLALEQVFKHANLWGTVSFQLQETAKLFNKESLLLTNTSSVSFTRETWLLSLPLEEET